MMLSSFLSYFKKYTKLITFTCIYISQTLYSNVDYSEYLDGKLNYLTLLKMCNLLFLSDFLILINYIL